MNSLATSVRRRFSSNASTITEPSSPGADARRPTLPTISLPVNAKHHSSDAITPLLDSGSAAELPPSRGSSRPSQYELAPEYMYDDASSTHTTYRPFPTMADLCREENLFYPLERQGHPPAYIDDVGGYSGPAMHSDAVTMTVRECGEMLPVDHRVYEEPRAPPMRRMSRRVSNAGRQARKWSGELGRRASKILRFSMIPVITHSKRRDDFDLEQEWHDPPQVQLGREIHEDEQNWSRAIEEDFRIVTWQ